MRREQSGVICLYSGRGGDGSVPASSLHFSPSALTPPGASPLASQTTRGAEGECLTLGGKLKGLLLGKGVDQDAFTLEHYFQMNVRNFLKQPDSSISPSRQYTALGKARWDVSIPSLCPAVQRGSHRGSASFIGRKGASRHSFPMTRKDYQIRAQHPTSQQASNSHNEEAQKKSEILPAWTENFYFKFQSRYPARKLITCAKYKTRTQVLLTV